MKTVGDKADKDVCFNSMGKLMKNGGMPKSPFKFFAPETSLVLGPGEVCLPEFSANEGGLRTSEGTEVLSPGCFNPGNLDPKGNALKGRKIGLAFCDQAKWDIHNIVVSCINSKHHLYFSTQPANVLCLHHYFGSTTGPALRWFDQERPAAFWVTITKGSSNKRLDLSLGGYGQPFAFQERIVLRNLNAI